ncbi:molybdopterin molybdotransferase MoeA [Pannonibacter tanglangensis]|uniref:Molybdopterin molybdenumtransferase n=1 Tax=Pannonibacter tanglangensis TaxID=2750084 RepID=A0ABW9ZM59_9HYPH|nr:gephyrin-like molybdotransferase Glp [Pannonibacter sp. XCT-34]NBN64109.1 molybdopterin molybdenumtransferase MoeA [Pannonibacter sp. XCT-34]
MSLMPVEDARAKLLSGVVPLGVESVPVAAANGRVLAADLAARRTQPPFPASAMDGYALRAADAAAAGARLTVIGEAPAGHGFTGTVGPGDAVRIFTGAPVPAGADSILIQENASRSEASLTVLEPVRAGQFVRPAGLDFSQGDVLLRAGTRLDFKALALAAAMNHAALPVWRKPLVAIIATGDELVPPGQTPGPDQIIASNHCSVAALVEDCGGIPLDLGIAADDPTAIALKVREGIAAGADVLVTLGGASVGDHDLVQSVLGSEGMELAFWKIAMRPGKPLMAGHLGRTKVLGLPGNPVSSLVCALLFLRPLLYRLTGQPDGTGQTTATLTAPVPANDQRQDYLRARLTTHPDGTRSVTPFDRQDSSMLGLLAASGALIIREPHAPAAHAGDRVDVLVL